MSRCSGEMKERDGSRCCTYCGSLSVQDVIKFMKQPGTRFSGSDWKYGWPHKFYVEPVNPNAAAECWQGTQSHDGDKKVDGSHMDDFWTCQAHGSEINLGPRALVDSPRKPACGCPRDESTGYWSRGVRGTYAKLHLKFYNVHLSDATDEELKEFSELSASSFGIAWSRDEKGIKYSAPRTNSFYGFQRAGQVGEDGRPVHSI